MTLPPLHKVGPFQLFLQTSKLSFVALLHVGRLFLQLRRRRLFLPALLPVLGDGEGQVGEVIDQVPQALVVLGATGGPPALLLTGKDALERLLYPAGEVRVGPVVAVLVFPLETGQVLQVG